MNESSNHPVEISTRMRPGEWTPESLQELTKSYQEKIYSMGAPVGEVETSVKTPEDGSAHVYVSWRHTGVKTFADLGDGPVAEAGNSRGHGEAIPRGEPTKDSQGVGAVFGDADRSAIDEPPATTSAGMARDQSQNEYLIYTSEDGQTFVEDAGPAKE